MCNESTLDLVLMLIRYLCDFATVVVPIGYSNYAVQCELLSAIIDSGSET